jgi:hypothetical protein
MKFNINNKIFLYRCIKYVLEGGIVAAATYFIPSRGKVDYKEIAMISITAATIFLIIDIFASTPTNNSISKTIVNKKKKKTNIVDKPTTITPEISINQEQIIKIPIIEESKSIVNSNSIEPLYDDDNIILY